MHTYLVTYEDGSESVVSMSDMKMVLSINEFVYGRDEPLIIERVLPE